MNTRERQSRVEGGVLVVMRAGKKREKSEERERGKRVFNVDVYLYSYEV